MLHGVLLLDGRQPIGRGLQLVGEHRIERGLQPADGVGEERIGADRVDPGESSDWTTQKFRGS